MGNLQKHRFGIISLQKKFSKMRVLLCVAALVVVSLAKNVERFEFEPLSDEQIDYINNVAKPSWKAGRNFEKESLQNVIGTLGTDMKANALYNEANLKQKDVVVRDDLPKEFDARTKWPQCKSIGEIRDQANCGSCWALGAVEVMTDRICIKGGGDVHISASDLLSCCRDCGFKCEGGFPTAAFHFYERHGIVTGGQYGTKQGCYPYQIPHCDHHVKGKYKPCAPVRKAPKCHKQCEAGYPKTYEQDKQFGKNSYGVTGVDKIAQEIVDNGPVEASFTVYADFLTYKSGIYKHTTGEELGGHSIKFIGYGTENGQDYWLAVNSWNEDWGDKGYFKIAKGNDECGIESQIVTGEPKL